MGAVDVHPVTVIEVPLPKITRMGEVRNPVYLPVPAVAHLANQRPAPAGGGES